MKLFVIMGNDYPSGVMDNEQEAKALVDKRNTMDPELAKFHGRRRIYWKVHPFALNQVED